MTKVQNVCRAIALASGMMLSATTAFSADLGGPSRSMKDGPYEPVALSQWSGFYVGLQGGYLWGDARHSFSNGAPSDNSDPDGFIGGGHIGFNLQSGGIVYGIEADFEGGDVNGGFTNVTGATSVGTVDLNWQGSVRARLGLAHDRTLFYVTVAGRSAISTSAVAPHLDQPVAGTPKRSTAGLSVAASNGRFPKTLRPGSNIATQITAGHRVGWRQYSAA